MRNIAMMGLILLLLLSFLGGTFYLGYNGVGISAASSGSVREGSTTGPIIRSGGPSSGK